MTTPGTAARLLVVDDHPIVRLGIRQMVSTDAGLSICGEASTAEEALEQIRTSEVDLAIVDLGLQAGGGLSLIRSLHELSPDLLVLVLSMHDEALFAERALRAGARGYIMKQEAVVGLVHAVRQVLSGRIYLSEHMSQRLLEQIGPHEQQLPADSLAHLTDRELEVFEMIGHGTSTAVVADRLGISVKTVETYRSNIKTKLNLKDGFELLKFASSWIERA
jgi:DNA-binding NarL/FixJ family response regulator